MHKVRAKPGKACQRTSHSPQSLGAGGGGGLVEHGPHRLFPLDRVSYCGNKNASLRTPRPLAGNRQQHRPVRNCCRLPASRQLTMNYRPLTANRRRSTTILPLNISGRRLKGKEEETSLLLKRPGTDLGYAFNQQTFLILDLHVCLEFDQNLCDPHVARSGGQVQSSPVIAVLTIQLQRHQFCGCKSSTGCRTDARRRRF